jgi:hypothetical protein
VPLPILEYTPLDTTFGYGASCDRIDEIAGIRIFLVRDFNKSVVSSADCCITLCCAAFATILSRLRTCSGVAAIVRRLRTRLRWAAISRLTTACISTAAILKVRYRVEDVVLG